MALWYIGLIEEDGRFRAIDEHEAIPRRAALGLNHYPALLAAARAVVDAWDSIGFGDTFRAPEHMRDSIAALRAAVEAAERELRNGDE